MKKHNCKDYYIPWEIWPDDGKIEEMRVIIKCEKCWQEGRKFKLEPL